MTIRLKLTLIYSLIIALILIVFSLILHSTQRWTTMNAAQKSLNYHFSKIVETQPATPGSGQGDTSDYNPNYSQIYTQIRSPEGQIILRPDSSSTNTTLPLSSDGLQAVNRGEDWVEFAAVDGGHFLIRSQSINDTAETRQILQVALSVEDRYEFLNELRNILIIADTLVIIAAFGIGWILAGLTLRPIHRITETARAVGEQRDFSRRVEHTGPNDEIGQLANMFNNMLTQLQEAYIQIEQSLQVQRRFVADASHELRTPLTTVRGNLGLLQREPPISTEDRLDILNDTVDETDRLIRLVNDLLVLARADARQPLRNELVQVRPLLEDVCRQIKLLAPQRTIVYNPDHNITITGDYDGLKQILLALLDNALKHTPPETTITLAAAVNGKYAKISVGDNGPGIDPAKLPHIFDRFYRGDAARTGTNTGLGLAIANELTTAQNGTLTVESQVGRGSVFALTFPLLALSNQADETQNSQPNIHLSASAANRVKALEK